MDIFSPEIIRKKLRLRRARRRDKYGRFLKSDAPRRDKRGRYVSTKKKSRAIHVLKQTIKERPAHLYKSLQSITMYAYKFSTTPIRELKARLPSRKRVKSVQKFYMIRHGSTRKRVYRNSKGRFTSKSQKRTLNTRILLRFKKPSSIKLTHTKISLKRPRLDSSRLALHYSRITVVTVLTLVTAGAIFYITILKDLPSISQLTQAKTPQTTIIRDRDGRVLYRIYKSANRVKLSWEDIPQVVKDATLAIEDDEFWYHHGISVTAMTRAFLHNFRYKDMNNLQGGSTITQQLVKNKLLTPDRTIERKLKEVILSLLAEVIYTKEDIFTMYLNEVGYGGPAYGIEAAAQMYFGKSARNVSLSQAAFLAGLPAAPTTYSPFGPNPKMATIRQHQVLARMRELEMIPDEKYYEAVNSSLILAAQKIDIQAPHFVMYVKKELVASLGEDVVEEGGLDVVTTLDLDVQKKAESIVAHHIGELKDRYRIRNGASVVVDPKSGEILAMVGSADYFDIANDGHVNATDSLRQPGSAIKALTYALAFDNGYNPTTVIDDAPVVYKSPGSRDVYAPKNYDGKFHGRQTVRMALANSYNIPAVKTLNKFGVDNMITLGKAMGVKSWSERAPTAGLSLTLGGSELTMLDMARLYATIANMGVTRDLRVVKQISDSTRKNLTAEFYRGDTNLSLVGSVEAAEGDKNYVEGEQIISPLTAWWLIDILSDNVARLPAFGRNAKLSIPGHKIVVKTGTSNNFRDNWTIGFTPSYLVATWVGNNDGSFMNSRLVSGITGAAPIWHEIMSTLLSDVNAAEFKPPEGVIPVKICATNGLLTCPNCPREKIEYFTADKVPTKKCSFRSAAECTAVKAQAEAENKSEEEKKELLSGCAWVK